MRAHSIPIVVHKPVINEHFMAFELEDVVSS